ncbi:3-phosphoshikimate 1-carboxyvinyltransferase [soil metagenome]
MRSFEPSGPLRGSLRPPPDKSISHRAAILAAMGEGETRIEGFLDAADTRSSLAAVEALGARVSEREGSEIAGGADVTIAGVGLRGAGGSEPVAIDVGNAGTLLRLLPGWLAGQEGSSFTLDGDDSIRRRPVDRIAEPLRQMGAQLDCRDDRLPPLGIDGRALRGVKYKLPVASAQIKSCVLLAGLLAEGETTVIEPSPSRDHSERMLRAAGAKVRSAVAGTDIAAHGSLPGRSVTITPRERIALPNLQVPGDFSSAAFHIAAALIVPGSRVTVTDVGLNPTRVGLLGILTRMGAAIEVVEGIPVAGEPRGAITARHSNLHGTRVAPGEVPLAIDELPLVGLLGCFARGETVVTGAEELRHKESNRIEAVVSAISALGGEAEETADGFVVRGTEGVRGGSMDARGDHRLAMIGAVAGLASERGVEVEMESAAISYPGFERDLSGLLRGPPPN